jgi:putative ABC transport system ATP-binding protein
MDNITLESIRPLVKVGMFGATSDLWGNAVTLNKGKHYLFRSRSGRGKTSAMAFIYGLRNDFSGTIRFDHRDISTFSFTDWSAIRQESVSVVFQDLRLFRQLTALGNVMLKGAIGAETSGEEVMEMFNRLGISRLIDKPAGTLSFGEQQRVAIIRALVQPFDFLLMDEPFSHLDTSNTSLAAQMILEACAARSASLILTSLGDDYGISYEQIIEV